MGAYGVMAPLGKPVSRNAKADRRAARFRAPGGGKLGAAPERPIWIRYPKDGELCPWSGLTRFKMRELCEPTAKQPKPLVRSVSVPNAGGNKRNVQLIHLQSLLDYLDSLGADQPVPA